MTAKLEEIVAELALKVAEHERVIAGLRAALGVAGGGTFAGGADIASDADLDGPHGNEKIRMNPRDWKGTPRKGELMSRVEPEFLDLYADAMLHFASKNDAAGDARKARFDRLAAARARGWAQRKRNGWQPSTDAGAASTSKAWGSGAVWGSRPSPTPPQAANGQQDPRASDSSGGDDDGYTDDEIPF